MLAAVPRRVVEFLTPFWDLCPHTPPACPQWARAAVMGEVPSDDVVKLGSFATLSPRQRTRRHQLPLRVSHKLGKQIVHPLHMLGAGRRVPESETTCVRIQVASQKYTLVSTLYDAFGQDLPCVLLELHVT